MKCQRCPISSRLFRQALQSHKVSRISDNYEQDKTIRIPTINSASDAIVHDLFADCLEVSYYSKRVVFDFE